MKKKRVESVLQRFKMLTMTPMEPVPDTFLICTPIGEPWHWDGDVRCNRKPSFNTKKTLGRSERGIVNDKGKSGLLREVELCCKDDFFDAR